MLPEFERALKLDEQLLRHLIVLDEGAQMSTVPTSKDEEEE
jgi:ribosomal protein S6